MRSVSSSWALEHSKHRSTAKISSQFGNVGPQYSVHFFPKKQSWDNNSLVNTLSDSEVREKCCHKWVLFVTEASWGFLCSKCCCSWYIIPKFVAKSHLCSSSTLFGIRSEVGLKWVMTNYFSLMEETKVSTFVVVFNKYWWEENGFKLKDFSTFMLGLLGGSSFLKGCAGSDTSLKVQQCCLCMSLIVFIKCLTVFLLASRNH